MPYLEAEIGVIHGRLVEGVRIPFKQDLFFETVILPGFSDTHAHPQVIDAGLSPSRIASWSNSYEWLETRRLVVNEAMVRSDLGLSARLAELALKRMALEGVTLAAFTGVLEANLKARLRVSPGPRLVLLPTLMDREGWSRPGEISRLYEKYGNYLEDDYLRPGIFVHSLRMASRETFSGAVDLALRSRMPLGLHLSEGVSEARDFARAIGGYKRLPRIVAVHCINDDPSRLGIRCSSCPASNMLLYGKTRNSLRGVTSFGSDWPHLIASMPRHLGLITRLYPASLGEILFRATTGGYMDYGVSYHGDFVAYDAPLESVIEGGALPRMVSVGGEVVVEEGRLTLTGESLEVVVEEIVETVKYAVELYGDGLMPYIPGEEAIENIAKRLDADSSLNLVRELLWPEAV